MKGYFENWYDLRVLAESPSRLFIDFICGAEMRKPELHKTSDSNAERQETRHWSTHGQQATARKQLQGTFYPR
jgi:hypothetical protein